MEKVKTFMRQCRAGQTTNDAIIQRMRFKCWITKATHTHTHRTCTRTHSGFVIFICCFSTATVVTWTRLCATLYVHCLSCSEAPSFPASQESPRILWNHKVHPRVYKSPILVPIRKYINPFYSLPFYFLKILFNIIFSSTPRSSKWALLACFLHTKTCMYHFSSSACHINFPSFLLNT